MTEPVEALDLRLGVLPHVARLRQVGYELADARADLVGEVRRRRPHEGVDVVAGRLTLHGGHSLVNVEAVRRRTVDLLLLGTVILWALNSTTTRYVLTHGFQPLAYATTRYAAATAIFWGYTYLREGSFRIARRDIRYVAVAATMIFVNQLCFVYSIDKTSAATVTLFLGATPIFIGIITSVIGLERMGNGFWIATVVSLIGVAFVASGSGGFSGHLFGDLLAIGTALTWGMYSISITPLLRRYSPVRISSLVLLSGWVPIAIVGFRQTTSQSFAFSALMWVCFAYAVIGPLFLTTILWFTAINEVGPSRASLFSNFQPVVGVVFAIVLLGESLTRWELVGGAIILGAVLVERSRQTTPVEPPGD
jgi:drug/metabolite transporter (DMT)-like permease